MTDPVDPSTPEREARENVTLDLLEMEQASYSPTLRERRRVIVEASVDAYAAAVRARALADVAGWVEGMRWSAVALPFMTEAECRDGYARLIRKSDILAKLREAK